MTWCHVTIIQCEYLERQPAVQKSPRRIDHDRQFAMLGRLAGACVSRDISSCSTPEMCGTLIYKVQQRDRLLPNGSGIYKKLSKPPSDGNNTRRRLGLHFLEEERGSRTKPICRYMSFVTTRGERGCSTVRHVLEVDHAPVPVVSTFGDLLTSTTPDLRGCRQCLHLEICDEDVEGCRRQS